jgi:Membrane protein implicated in regulation of membrane protease activity
MYSKAIPLSFMIPLPIIWILIGVIFTVIEVASMGALAFVGQAAGFMAFVIALLSMFVPQVEIQVVVWILLSVFTIWYSRRFMPKDQILLMEAQEGKTLTEVKSGKAGRVRFEGQSWRAICDIQNLEIPAGAEVIIMEKRGNTLVIVPKSWLGDRP